MLKAGVQKKSKRVIKKHYDELRSDTRFKNPDVKFRIITFNSVIDINALQLKTRLNGFFAVVNKFKVISSKFLTSAINGELLKSAIELAREYKNDLNNTFPTPVLSFRSALRYGVSKCNGLS